MMMLKVSQIFCSFSDDSFWLLRLGLASDRTPTPAAAPPNPALVTERRVLNNHGLFEKVVSPCSGPLSRAQTDERLLDAYPSPQPQEGNADILTTFNFIEWKWVTLQVCVNLDFRFRVLAQPTTVLQLWHHRIFTPQGGGFFANSHLMTWQILPVANFWHDRGDLA